MFGRGRSDALRLVALVGLCVGAGQVVAKDPDIKAGASEPAKAWANAMEAGDLAALARMHDADTISFPPSQMEVRGGTAIMRDYAELFAAYTVKVTFDDAHYVAAPPLVVSWGVSTLILHPKAGGPDVVSHARFTDAAIRIDGGWRYVVDHASVPTSRK